MWNRRLTRWYVIYTVRGVTEYQPFQVKGLAIALCMKQAPKCDSFVELRYETRPKPSKPFKATDIWTYWPDGRIEHRKGEDPYPVNS